MDRRWRLHMRRMHGVDPWLAMGGRDWPFGSGAFGRDFDDGDGREGGGRHGGRRKRMFESGELRLVMLELIAREPRHGYDIIRALEEMTGGSYAPSPGTVYPTLTYLEEMDLIEEIGDETSKRLFCITKAGKAYLKERREEVDRVMARLERTGARQDRVRRTELKTAIAKIGAAVWTRVAQEKADEEMVEDIAAILEKAAEDIRAL